jgi:hypothetical protein
MSTDWPQLSPDQKTYIFFLWVFVKGKVEIPTVPISWKYLNQIRRAIAKCYQYLVQNICYHAAYFIDVGRETNRANTEPAQETPKHFSRSTMVCVEYLFP